MFIAMETRSCSTRSSRNSGCCGRSRGDESEARPPLRVALQPKFMTVTQGLHRYDKAATQDQTQMSSSLLLTRRFAPLFWTQFFAAFSDNFLKQALIFLILFKIQEAWGSFANVLVMLAPVIF